MKFTVNDFTGYNTQCKTIRAMLLWGKKKKEFTIAELDKAFPNYGVYGEVTKYMALEKLPEYIKTYAEALPGIIGKVEERIKKFNGREEIKELRNEISRYKERFGVSPVLIIMKTLYSSSKRELCDTGLSPILRDALDGCIMAQIPFEENDFQNVWDQVRGWGFHTSSNGKSFGEHFYQTACHCNDSAAASFEKFQNRSPFILGNHRLFDGAEFKLDNIYWAVTGWNEAKEMTCCGYEKENSGDHKKRGKRTLRKYTREQWLEARKNATLLTQYSIR